MMQTLKFEVLTLEWCLNFAQLLFAVSEQSALGTFSSLLPPGLAALLRSAGFFSGVVFVTRLTRATSAFHGFLLDSKGAKEVTRGKLKGLCTKQAQETLSGSTRRCGPR